MLGCFVILTVRVGPVWSDVVQGFLPSKVLFEPRPIFLGVSILGATVMPHALFLGSHVGTINRLSEYDGEPKQSLTLTQGQGQESEGEADPRERGSATVGPSESTSPIPNLDEAEAAHVVPLSLPVIRLHLRHASADIILSLLGFAMCINALILIVAAAAFYRPGDGGGEVGEVGDLFDAYELLRVYLGPGSAMAFAIALLASAQCSSITVTLAGQIISEGFVRWKFSPLQRRMVTRLVAIVPSFLVAAAVGRKGLNEMLIVSQVALSMALPFVTLPLLLLTSFKGAMRIWDAASSAIQTIGESTRTTDVANQSRRPVRIQTSDASERTPLVSAPSTGEPDSSSAPGSWVSFVNPWWLDVISWVTFGTICIADAFVLATGG